MHDNLRRYAAASVACILLGIGSRSDAASPPPVAAERGMVVAAHPLATRIGVDVLRRGGNAVDAAVAVGYALAVVYPSAGNLGGGGFMTLRLADGRQTFLDYRETAPMAATRDMYLDAQGKLVPRLSTRGHLAVAVPGSVAGLELARARFGSRPRAELIAPAERLARQGFRLSQGDIDLLALANEDLRADAASAAVFLKNGRPLRVGERLVQRDLARTLGEIARRGEAGFYRGRVAARLAAASRRGGGIIGLADLEKYRPRELAPIECDYRGLRIVSAPPPSSGGIVLCEMLNVLEGYPLRELGFRSAQAIHFQIEVMRHAYFDRNSFLGDPDFVANPVARLTDKDYARRLRDAIDPSRAGDSNALGVGSPPHEGSNTTHYSIVDRAGNAVAVTTTLNDAFGARVTAAGTGVLLNNEMDDFTAKPGVANLYGLVQGEANAIVPGKRPLSSMTPTIVVRAGAPLMVLGTPGGSRIISAVLHTLLNVIDYGMTIQEAVDAPRFHQQWQPETTSVEPFALSPDSRALLEAMGHKFAASGPANHVTAILVGAPSLAGKPVGRHRYYGANDPRGYGGLALGY